MIDYKIGIIGCGNFAKKRLKSLNKKDISFICDINDNSLFDFSNLLLEENDEFLTSSNYMEFANKNIADIIIISTPNSKQYEIAKEYLEYGKHVLLEKPGGKNAKELKELQLLANEKNVVLRVGYNLSFHPAIIKGYEYFDNQDIGEIISINGYYGNGTASNLNTFENNWRSNYKLSGGGSARDLMVHLLDLTFHFLSQSYIANISSVVRKLENTNIDLSTNIMLEFANGAVANLQSNFQEIKNKFYFEVCGTTGKIVINGLGDSYGTETLSFYKLNKNKIKPQITKYEYLEEDSLAKEWEWFLDVISMSKNRKTYNNYFLERNFVTANIIDDIYIRNGINPYDNC